MDHENNREVPQQNRWQPVHAAASPIHAGQSVAQAFVALAGSCAHQWEANVVGASHSDPSQAVEFIHQIRVALRRLRSALKAFAPALPTAFSENWQHRLRENADRFGPARDLDVLRTEVLDPVTPGALVGTTMFEQLVETIDAERQTAHQFATRTLVADEQVSDIREFKAALQRLSTNDIEEGLKLSAFTRERLTCARRRARRRFNEASALDPVPLHRLRIGMKELRYAVEFFAPLLRQNAVRTYVEQLSRAQTTLGYLQDMEVARVRLERWRHETPECSLAIGFVLGWHGARHAQCRNQVMDDTRPALWGSAPWRHR